MSYYDDKIVINGMTKDDAQSLKDSHESYGNPAYDGSVEIVKGHDDSYAAIYDRKDVKDAGRIYDDAALFGGHTQKLYD